VYGDADNAKSKKRERPQAEEEVKPLDYEEAAAMNPRERKLRELREKFKQSRNDNKKAVEEEDKKNFEGTDAQETKRRRMEYYETQDADRREAEEAGVDLKKKQVLNTTAEEAEARLKKSQKKKHRQDHGFGWEKFTSDAEHNAYKNRQKDSHFSKEEYEKQKQQDPNFYRTASNLDYGQDSEVSREKKLTMVKELDKLIARRSDFSRRREFFDEEDVTFINERNRVFNKKLARAFDPYTAEIKENLERGTAV